MWLKQFKQQKVCGQFMRVEGMKDDSSFKRNCSTASVGKWNSKFWYQQVDKGEIFHREEIAKLIFRALALALTNSSTWIVGYQILYALKALTFLVITLQNTRPQICIVGNHMGASKIKDYYHGFSEVAEIARVAQRRGQFPKT